MIPLHEKQSHNQGENIGFHLILGLPSIMFWHFLSAFGFGLPVSHSGQGVEYSPRD
jgi:hypothetical protein